MFPPSHGAWVLDLYVTGQGRTCGGPVPRPEELYRPVHTGEVYLLGVRERSPSMGTSVNPGIGAGFGGLGGPEAIPMGRYIVPREV